MSLFDLKSGKPTSITKPIFNQREDKKSVAIKISTPFGSPKREVWENLALLALAVFFIAQFGMDVAWKNICGQLAIDYCSFWSAGVLANSEGYAEVYNLNKMEEIQRTVFPRSYEAEGTTATIPTPYLPVFLIPFQAFSLLSPQIGFWIWTFINATTITLYLYFFVQQTTHKKLDVRLLLMLFLSLPVFLNLFKGQVDFWLTICVGEYIRDAISDRHFRAGLWLSGLLAKPQFLIVVGLALLIQRSQKIIAGLAIGSIVIAGVSLFLAGQSGLLALIELWLGFTRGLPATGPEVMMNWRMVILNLTPYLGQIVPWVIAGIGMIVTFAAAISIWIRPINISSPSYVLALFGTFAATNALAWHSHLSSATILIPPLIYLFYKSDHLPKNIVSSWTFIPQAFRFLVFILIILVQEGILSNNLTGMINFLTAISLLVLNIYILAWSATQVRKLDPSAGVYETHENSRT